MIKHLVAASAVCLTLFAAGNAFAQDIHFSQFYETSPIRNPALTGIFSGDYKAGVNYRTQWSSLSAPYQTILASGEARISVNSEVGDFLSFGLTTTYDKAGTINFNSLQVYPSVAYNKALAGENQTYLSVGFAGGYIQRSIDLSKATYSSQYVNGEYSQLNMGDNINNSVVRNFDLGAGVSLNSTAGSTNQINYYIGAGAYHLAKPKQAFNRNDEYSRLQTKWVGNAGFKYRISDVFAFTSHFNFIQQGPHQQIMGGGLISWQAMYQADGFYIGSTPGAFTLYAGAYVRYKDAIIPTIKMDYKTYSLTCSYDINTSPLKAGTSGAGGFEMSLFIRGHYKGSISEQTRCPHFEQMLPMFL